MDSLESHQKVTETHLEVLDDPVQRRGGELGVEPAVVEEKLREEI